MAHSQRPPPAHPSGTESIGISNVPKSEIKNLVKDAYDLIVAHLSKAQRAELKE